jgi:HlyD family secretion protein
MRFLLISAGVTLVVLLGLMIDAQSRTPANHSVDQPGPRTIFAPGRIEGATPEIELRPRLAGRVVQVLVEEGQLVQQGQVLLQLDDEQYRHQVALAAAELDLTEAQLERLLNGAHYQERAEAAAVYRAKLAELERAELSWKRINQLREARAIPQQDADDQRTLVASLTAEVAAAKARLELLEAPARPDEVLMAKARIEAAKARLQLADVQLERTKLRAPSGSQILKIDVELGELTGPNSPQPAVTTADTSRYQVRAFVEELDAPRVKLGMIARIVADGMPDRQLTGRVIRLSPRMSRKELFSDDPAERYDVKTREVWIELEEGQSLVVGLPVDVIIDPASGTPASTEPVKSQGPKPGGQPPPELTPP